VVAVTDVAFTAGRGTRALAQRSYRWCYHGAMGVTKRSVSLDAAVAAAVELAADEAGVSFSAWLGEAARHQLRISEGLRAVEEWESEAGGLTDEERAAGELLLGHLLGEPPGGTRGA